MTATPYRIHVQKVAALTRVLMESRSPSYWSEQTGVSPQSWWRVRTGQRDLRFSEVLSLCKTLDVSIDEFTTLLEQQSSLIAPAAPMREVTPSDLRKLAKISPSGEPPEGKWFVFRVLAADNIIDRSDESFSPKAIQDIVALSAGIPFISNHHQGEVDSAFGVVISAGRLKIPWDVFQGDRKLSQLVKMSGRGKEARRVLRRDGFHGAIYDCAVPATAKELPKIRAGLTNHVSISFCEHSSSNWSCPECNTPFDHPNCSHISPVRPYLVPGQRVSAWGEDLTVVSHMVRQSVSDMVEVSLVTIPCLPAAQILNADHPLIPYIEEVVE